MESFTLTFLLILFCIIPLFIKLLKHDYSTKKSKKPKLPPGPKPWPIFGNIPEMLANKPTFRWIQNIMNDLNTEIACIRLGNIHVIPVTSPSIAREILMKQDAIFASRPLNWSSEYITSGYITAAVTPFGEQWKKMRRVVMDELVSPLRHQWMHDKRTEEADNLVWYVYNQCKHNNARNGSALVDIRLTGQHYCGNLIRRLFFNKRYFGNGREDGGPGAEELEHVEAILIVLEYLFASSISDYVPLLREFDLDGHKKAMKEAANTIRKYHDPIIEERIRQWRNGTRTHQEDWLDVLISLKDANNNPLLTIDEIKAEVLELMTTIDNPYNNVEWVLSEMLNQPELLEKATKELDYVVGKNRQVQESDIPKLNYVKACVKEGFRLHPIVDFSIPHVPMEDTIVANYFIPKGSHCILRRQGIGQNPRVWEDEPLKFKPERHLKKDGSNLTLSERNLDMITFSTGRRSCPGFTLGSTMTIMLFARLVHGFTWIAPPNEPIIDLSECDGNTSKAKPLVALGKPRLSAEVYSSIMN